ncbi:MAG: EAL domain-containing protein [Helicobacteraceae bacterium]|nr:EAL domain-containing protein [Helicobacteraceae bacterium]
MDNFEHYLNNSPSAFFKWRNDATWSVSYASINTKKLFGYTQEQFLSQEIAYAKIIHPEDLSRVTREVHHAIEKKVESFEHEPYRVITAEKQTLWVEDTTRIQRDEKGEILYFYGHITDVTNLINYEKELEKNILELEIRSNDIAQYQKALDESYIISKSDIHGNITHVNQNLIDISGYSREELIGKPHSILRNPITSSSTFKDLWETIEAKKVWKGLLANLSKRKYTYYVNLTIVPILDSLGDIREYLAIRYDMTDYIAQQNRLHELSYTSSITGTKNIAALNKKLQEIENGSIALVNINRFNNLNNLYGYTKGDEVIKKLSSTILILLNNTPFELYHIHVDEFAILNFNTPFENFKIFMQEIQAFINANKVLIDNKEIPINITVTLSQEKKEDLITSCSMAMHQAKAHRDKFRIYEHSEANTKQYQDNIDWTIKIQDAIKNSGVIPFYQPIFDTQTQELIKYEALMRLQDKANYASPFFFLDIAKRSNLYIDLSLSMIQKVFEQIKNSQYTFSINLTSQDIESDQVRSYCYEMLQDHAIASRTIFEIVESEELHNIPIVNEFLLQAKTLGAKISIDDFGTGYSNFEYLLRLEADIIKIDGSLIKNIDTSIDSEDIVRTIVSFAKRKNIKVVAEFVSSQEIYDKVKEIGIDFVQGYHFGQPNITLDIVK